MAEIIGTRIKALRKQRGLSQDRLAQLFGFKDRQTVSAIETGVRRVTATELLLAVEKLGAPLDYFTDPFRLDGEANFSWRQSGVGRRELGEYERKASQWVGAYRALAAQIGRPMPLMRRTLGLTRASRFEDAVEAGERFANELDVSSSALRWRLVALGRLTRATAQAVPELALRNNGGANEAQAAPPLFSRPFMEVIASAIDQGYLSVRRASALAGLPIEDIEDLFEAHDIEFAIGQ